MTSKPFRLTRMVTKTGVARIKFKVSFARIVNEAQLVEAVVEADSFEEARDKTSAGEFLRFLVVKREANEVTEVGTPDIEQIR